MKAQSEIKKSLWELAVKFPEYNFLYWIDKIDGDHIVEVHPANFEDSDSFINEEFHVISNFYKNFPDQNLTFLQENEILFKSDLLLVDVINSNAMNIKAKEIIFSWQSKERKKFTSHNGVNFDNQDNCSVYHNLNKAA